MKNLKNKKGFTLIELIVVLAILGILMLILVPSFLGYANDAKTQVNKANARTLWTAAKAAETKAEYDANIEVMDCDKAITGDPGQIPNNFCNEVALKAGTAFDGNFLVTVTKAAPIRVESVTFKNGTTTCVYKPTVSEADDDFSGC